MIAKPFYITLAKGDALNKGGRSLETEYLILDHDPVKDRVFFFNDDGVWTNENTSFIRFKKFYDAPNSIDEEKYVEELEELKKENEELKIQLRTAKAQVTKLKNKGE